MTNIIRILRVTNGLNQQELAHELGVTQGAVSQWESGASRPSSRIIPKLESVLGCKPGELDELKNAEAGAKVGRNAKKLTETSTIDESAKPRRRAKQPAALADGWED